MIKYIFISLLVAASLVGCDDLFEPAIENIRDLSDTPEDANFAQGLLINGYTRLPTNSYSFSDVATDDAVSNDRTNGYRKAATGQWTANSNPFDQWRNAKSAIQYMNLFLELADSVNWAKNDNARVMFTERLKGEAYGLRGLFMYYLLQVHGGYAPNGELMGVSIVLESETPSSNFNQPRASFEACMQQLYADLDKAESMLPLDYEDVTTDAQVPAKYTGVGKDDYNRVYGNYFRGRLSGRIAKAIRSKAALLAASPAFSAGNTTTYENAANLSGELLTLIGGISGLDATGFKWFANTADINGLAAGVNPKEILWRTSVGSSSDLEKQQFPPTLYGNGRVNPTQNLVDAFSMVNGYPITHASSTYNAAAPYTNRDPRLAQYILINGSKAGVSSTTIYTAADAATNDGLNKVETSTRTGYYMRKLLRQDVNLNPSSVNAQKHYMPHIRYTEIFLNYAEAANEAWGPQGKGTFAFSAYDVIKAIRLRAGVGKTNGDPYLESIKTDKDLMRELIRNERRLELCFEGFRFWDLRRWQADMSQPANGMSITGTTYSPIPVEARVYEPYMVYGPIPYSETLKYDALTQNEGW